MTFTLQAAKFSGSTKTANARFVTYLNGIKVQDGDAPAPGTGGATEGPSAGPIFLQNHGGDPVMFKNIWIVTNPQMYPDTNSLGLCDDGTSAWVNRCASVSLQSGFGKQNRSIPNAKGVVVLRNGEASFKEGANHYDVQGKKISREAGGLKRFRTRLLNPIFRQTTNRTDDFGLSERPLVGYLSKR